MKCIKCNIFFSFFPPMNLAKHRCSLLSIPQIGSASLQLLPGSSSWPLTSPKSAWSGAELLQEAPLPFTTPQPTPPALSAQAGAQHHCRDESKGRMGGKGGGSQEDNEMSAQGGELPVGRGAGQATRTPLTCTQPSQGVGRVGSEPQRPALRWLRVTGWV